MSSLKDANAALRAGRHAEALRLYEAALARAPLMSSHIRFNMAVSKKALGAAGGKEQSAASTAVATSPEPKCDEARPSERSSPVTRPGSDDPGAMYSLNRQTYSVDIVVPVHNALEDVERCLRSIERNTDGFLVRVFVVNDASDQKTTNYLRSFCAAHPRFELIENERNEGYTRSVNKGLRVSSADYVITLNSDTIVTRGWLKGLIRCALSDSQIGIVGPMSNAASWQNVPHLLDETKSFAVNELPLGMDADAMASLVGMASARLYPRVPFVNGFCFLISRAVVRAIGYLDEEAFPTGYGEENDYCLRAADAGFSLAIADDTYVFHAKSKSFGHDTRKKLSKAGSESLKAKHGEVRVKALAERIRNLADLETVRRRVEAALTRKPMAATVAPLNQRILFILPVSGGGGGVHSIVQEVIGMRRLGVAANVAVPGKHRHKFLASYSDVADAKDIFLGFDHDLVRVAAGFDVVVGTIFSSMKIVRSLKENIPHLRTAYYVQDYEPFFCPPGTSLWKEASASYTLVPGTTLFAKTAWICDKVSEMHGVEVGKVSPSIDHDVYRPAGCGWPDDGEKFVVSAMIRPKTPRRGAARTMDLLKQLHDRFGDAIEIRIFGCENGDPLFVALERNFPFVSHGVLSRQGVASILQGSDLFLDLSDYQAFGRTGLEAMACGCAVVITKFGGVDEYAIHDVNALLVDPFDQKGTVSAVIELLTDRQRLCRLKSGGIDAASRYSVHRAAVSELMCLAGVGLQ